MEIPEFLLPGTGRWRPAPTCSTPPHLGSILVCRMTDIECFLKVVVHVERLPSSVPITILVSERLISAIEPGVRLFDEARHGLTALIPWRNDTPAPPSLALNAINTRPIPSTLLLAQWLTARLGRPALFPLLYAAMGPGSATPANGRSRSTLLREVRDELHCLPSDLRRLVRLARVPRLAPAASHLSELAETTEAHLRHLVTVLLGQSLAFYNQHPGWEWVLEAACRQGLGAGGWGLGAGGWPRRQAGPRGQVKP